MNEPEQVPHCEARAGLATAQTSVLPEPEPDNEEQD